jgi:hypothetical protein
MGAEIVQIVPAITVEPKREQLAPDLTPQTQGAVLATQTTGGISSVQTIQEHYTVLLEMERRGDLRYRIDVRQMEVYGLNQLIAQLMMQMAQTTDAKVQQVQAGNIERLQKQRDAQQLDVDILASEWQIRQLGSMDGRYFPSPSWSKHLAIAKGDGKRSR